MRFHIPFPLVRHPSPGHGLDASPDLGFAQLMSADPSRVVSATHVADLVNSVLEGGNSAANESSQEMISHHPFRLELNDEFVNLVDLEIRLLGVEVPVMLFRGGTETECRQVQEIGIVRALHVEERALPLPT